MVKARALHKHYHTLIGFVFKRNNLFCFDISGLPLWVPSGQQWLRKRNHISQLLLISYCLHHQHIVCIFLLSTLALRFSLVVSALTGKGGLGFLSRFLLW